MGRCSAIGKDGVATLIVDFSSHASIHKAAADFKERFGRLDILVLNAGIVQGPADLIWQTNHVGPFVFTEALRPLLESAASTHGDARVVAVSSRTHQLGHIRYEGPYNSDKPSGACANHEDDWSKCWALTEACINNGLFT